MISNLPLAKQAEIKEIHTFNELKKIFFESLNEKLYSLFNGSETPDVLNNIRKIDSITIDNLIYTALFGVSDTRFLWEIEKTKGRKEAFSRRVEYGLDLEMTLDTVKEEDRLGILVDLFFIYPDGAQEKRQIMDEILDTYFSKDTNFSDNKNNFFESYDSNFYALFGVVPFSKEHYQKDSIEGMDSVTIDTYVFENLFGRPNSYLEFQDVFDLKREGIYNMRRKWADKELGRAHNSTDLETKIQKTVKAFMLAPKWSAEKDNALILLLKVIYGIEHGGKKVA